MVIWKLYVGNVDGDAADEVLYTQGYTRGNPKDDNNAVNYS